MRQVGKPTATVQTQIYDHTFVGIPTPMVIKCMVKVVTRGNATFVKLLNTPMGVRAHANWLTIVPLMVIRLG